MATRQESGDGTDASSHNGDMEEHEQAQTQEDAEGQPKEGRKPTIIIALIMAAFFLLGLYDFFYNVEENGCAMTYMYEYPMYIKINTSDEINQKFPKYGLYVYGEGKTGEFLERGQFTGIPVLFIPGNSGSYKQVRSLASVALRKALEDGEYDLHFDYFSVDFDEEFSAIYGGVLQQQADYAAHAVQKILQLYKQKSGKRPNSVVLIGHSLGGVIAKSLLVNGGVTPGSVSMILTLATPHLPVLLMDPHTHHFYHQVNDYWNKHRNSLLKDITLVNIAGGHRDNQVRSDLSRDPHGDFNVVTTAIPAVWVSTDHRCIVWCKQLVLVLNRVLFNMIDPSTKQITNDKQLRNGILQYHLVARSAGKTYKKDNLHPNTMRFDPNGYWSDVLKRQFTFAKGNATTNHYVMIRVSQEPNRRMLSLDAVRMDADDWLFGCKETRIHKNIRICDQGENLSGGSYIIPSRGKRKTALLDMHLMKKKFGYTYIVVHTPVDTEDTLVHIDLYDPSERSVTYQVPKWISFWRSYPVVQKTVAGAVSYNISLGGIEFPWQAYHIIADPITCSSAGNAARLDSTSTEDSMFDETEDDDEEEGRQQRPHFGLARFVTPWANDTVQVLLGRGENFTNTVTARLQTPRIPEMYTDFMPQVHFYLDPQCTYQIRIQAAFPQIMGQMIRYYGPMLLPCAVSVIILVLSRQMGAIQQDGYCKSPLLVLISNVSPIAVVPASRMLAYLFSISIFASFLPKTDIELIQTSGMDFGTLPIMLYFCSIGCVFLLGCGLWVAIIAAGGAAHQAIIKMSTRMTLNNDLLAEMAISGLTRFPVILAALLIAIGFATCGSLTLCLGLFCYFVKLFKMYEEYLEGLLKRSLGLRTSEDASMLSGLNFQMSLALLWLLSTVFNLPTLLTWWQNMGKGVSLASDPSLIHAVVLCGSMAILWQEDGKPKVEKKFYHQLSILLQFLAACILVYATITMYRIPFIISTVFAVMSTHQLAAPCQEDAESVDEESTDVSSAAPKQSKKLTKKKSDLSDHSLPLNAESTSESEYEYKYQLNVTRRKIKMSKLERDKRESSTLTNDTGLGVEGLDWDVESEDSHDVTVLIYPYHIRAWRRVRLLPREFSNQLWKTTQDALYGVISIFSIIWTHSEVPAPVIIEVTSATPEPIDDEYLPENHPLRKLRAKVPAQTVSVHPENQSGLGGFLKNLKTLFRSGVDFHWKFYHDLFTVIGEGLGFLLSLCWLFPSTLMVTIYHYLSGRKPAGVIAAPSQKSPTAPGAEVEARTEVLQSIGTILKFVLESLFTRTLNLLKSTAQHIKRRQEQQMEADQAQKVEPDPVHPQTGPIQVAPRSGAFSEDYSHPRNPRTAGKYDLEPLTRSSNESSRHDLPSLEVIERPLDVFKKDVQQQVDIISKHTQQQIPREPSIERIVVSGPWLQQQEEEDSEEIEIPDEEEFEEEEDEDEDKAIFVPGYREKRPESVTCGVYDHEPSPPPPRPQFDAPPLPSSSVFERDVSKSEFDVKVRGSPVMSQRNSGLFADDTTSQISDDFEARHGDFTKSTLNIHAACQLEDDLHSKGLADIRSASEDNDLLGMRQGSPDPDRDPTKESQASSRPSSLTRAGRNLSTSRPLGAASVSNLNASYVYEAPPESPDLRRRYSVKEEIAQLRQTVREELINFRSNEPDEAIASGGSGLDEEYERIVVMKYEKELEGRFGKPRSKDPAPPKRKLSRGRQHRRVPGSPPPYHVSGGEGDSDNPSGGQPAPPGLRLDSDEEDRAHNFSSSSSGGFRDWEVVHKEDIDELAKRRNLSESSGGSHKYQDVRHRSLSRDRSSKGDFRDRKGSESRDRKKRSSSHVGHRHSGDFTSIGGSTSSLKKPISPAHSLHNFQIKRRDSFLDISIPLDPDGNIPSDGQEAIEPLLFFSRTISETADHFQQTLSQTAERFSKTLDETAANLKKAISEKNIAHASTQELTGALHETAEILSKTSEALSQTAKTSFQQLGLQTAADVTPEVGFSSPRPPARKNRNSSQEGNFGSDRSNFGGVDQPWPDHERYSDNPTGGLGGRGLAHGYHDQGHGQHPHGILLASDFGGRATGQEFSDPRSGGTKASRQPQSGLINPMMDVRGNQQSIFPHRLDTITSQSEVEPSDTEPDPLSSNQKLNRPFDGRESLSPFLPMDNLPAVDSPMFDTRPSSANSDFSFRTPFGRTQNTRSARDIYDQMKPTVSTGSLKTFGRREESSSPDRGRFSRGAGVRGRERNEAASNLMSASPGRQESGRQNQKLPRTQSAVPINRQPEPSSHPPESRARSMSVTQADRPGLKKSSNFGGSTTSLYRTPSYRLLGGRLVESFYSRDTNCSEENSLSTTGAATSFQILKEPYIITTKDGKKQTLAEYEKNLIADYKRRSQQNLAM